jgi:HAD superfamily phosphoserine phosphatase-like hydrolase
MLESGNDGVDAHGLPTRRRPELVPEVVRRIPPNRDGALTIFDADGTLYTDDVADDFTTWMIDQGELPGDNWPTYMRIYRDDHPAGCRYLLSFYTGLTPAGLRQRLDHWWLHHARRNWIDEAVEAVFHLARLGYPIWLVSGTPTDLLLPLQRLLPVEQVVGMDFELDTDGRFTGRHAGISCAGEGKAEKLRSMVGDRPIRLAVGNGSLDGPMMELAEQAWSVYPNPEFAEYSRARGWPILPRPPDFAEEEKFLLED